VLGPRTPCATFRASNSPSILRQPDPAAVAVWRAATAADGTAVERHLREWRGISMDIPTTLRCGCGPSMIAAVQDAGGRIIAVQTAQLMPTGAKADIPVPRRTIGSLGEGAVRIGIPADVLGLAEGTE